MVIIAGYKKDTIGVSCNLPKSLKDMNTCNNIGTNNVYGRACCWMSITVWGPYTSWLHHEVCQRDVEAENRAFNRGGYCKPIVALKPMPMFGYVGACKPGPAKTESENYDTQRTTCRTSP